VSPVPFPRAMELVRRACLYDPPAEWMRERRPVEAFSTSLAHASQDGVFATAAGRYLGAEVKGQRGGNHFTHAIVTDDVTDFGQVRPAQLWRSPVWVDRTDGGTTCPPVSAQPDPGPLGPEQVQRWVGEQRDGAAVLVDLVSALERTRAGGQRVVVVASRAEQVLTWLAAATLLMPRPEALRLSFKVFAITAQYGEHDLVALHPDWAGAYRGAPPGLGVVVFDLDVGARSAVEPTEAAAFWVSRFLRSDVFDVLDAVELSGVLRSGDTVSGPERTAAAALALGEPVPEHEVGRLLDWLEAGGTGISPRRRDELFDLVVAGRPDPAQLRTLSRIAAGSDDAAFRERVRWQVFGVIVAMVDGRDPDGVTDAAQACRRLEAALTAASPEEVVTLLDLAADHAIAPNPARFADALQAFARWWADGGFDMPEVDRWGCAPMAVDLLRDELARRLAGSSAADREATGDLWWPRLWPTIQDPRSPLDEAVAAAAMKHGDAAVRSAVTRRVLDALSRAEDVTDVAWSALFSRRTAMAEDLLRILATARTAGPPSAWTVGAIADMLEGGGRPSRATLDVLVTLAELEVDLGRPVLRAMQREVLAVRGLPDRLPQQVGGRLDPASVQTEARQLAAISCEVLQVEAAGVIGALARLDPREGTSILLATPAEQRAVLVEELERAVGRRAADAMALGFVYMESIAELDKAGSKRLHDLLTHSGQALDQTARNRVAQRLDPEWHKPWFELCGERRLRARLRRPFRPAR
jgi:GTPase-associated protein 1, C-terminal domain/GTPase-associated protein 1, N-terminal domain type 2/GTPase-associated protein 1, middle domain